jgi:hypothetical protein
VNGKKLPVLVRHGSGFAAIHPVNQPFDLPPAAEMYDIPLFPALIGPSGSFLAGIQTKFFDKLRRIENGFTILQVELFVHKLAILDQARLMPVRLGGNPLPKKRFTSPGETGEEAVSHSPG